MVVVTINILVLLQLSVVTLQLVERLVSLPLDALAESGEERRPSREKRRQIKCCSLRVQNKIFCKFDDLTCVSVGG